MTALATFEVIASGPLTTVQDRGRPGLGSLGVGESGAVDTRSFALANRLVGNEEAAACLELTFGGLAVRPDRPAVVALTGAPCPVEIDGQDADINAAVRLPAGATLTVRSPWAGLRSYLAVRGGFDVPPVLGSRSTDLLSGMGPAPLSAGARLPVGDRVDGAVPPVDVAPVAEPPAERAVNLRLLPGPRDDWFSAPARSALAGSAYEVTSESNRIGMRLSGPVLERASEMAGVELPSEGMVTGALQVPPSGQPVLFLADHPVTVGYPVIGVVVAADLPAAAQARPGQRVRFRLLPRPSGEA